MNASLPGLPVAATEVALHPGVSKETPVNQSDSGSSDHFKGLLGEASSALSTPVQGAPPASKETGALSGELHSLPLDGKLLPLLQQTVEHLAAAGIDPHQFVEQLDARLKALSQKNDLPPADLLAMALQQLIQEQPALKSVLPGELLVSVVGNSAVQQAISGGETGAAAPNPTEIVRHGATSDSHFDQALLRSGQPYALKQDTSTGQTTLAPDNKLLPLQPLQVAASGQPPPELAALMTALKRMTAGSHPATASGEGGFHPDLPAVGLSAPGTHAAPVTSNAPAVVGVNTPLGQAGWDQALGERIQWLASQKIQGAQVKLNPAHLGPMEVRIHVHHDQASVQFTAQHAVVREALEAALPRLREMFNASGVQLLNVNVSSGQSFAEQQQGMQNPSKPHKESSYNTGERIQAASLETPLRAVSVRGYLDLFA